MVGSALLQMAREPVVVVLMLAAIVDLLSGSRLLHGIALLGVAAALAWDAFGGRADDVASSRRRPISLTLSPRWVVAGILYAVVVGSFARYSWPASIAVVVPGGAGVSAAWRGAFRRKPVPGRSGRGGMAWASVFVALGLWELLNLVLKSSGSRNHPTISELMDPVLASHAGRSLTLALWLALGWFLLER